MNCEIQGIMVVSCEKPTRVGEDPRVDKSEQDNGEERRGEGEMGDGRWEMGDGRRRRGEEEMD